MANNTNDRTFKPTIREGQILAGGMRIAEVGDGGQIVFEDRYRRRCLARGTDNVPVDLMEFLETLMHHYREGAG